MEMDLTAKLNEIRQQAAQAARELIEAAKPEEKQIFVVGCSSSEVIGGHIGHDSSVDVARAVFEGIYPVVKEAGLYLAAQCCEHLNRAIILEKEAAERYGWEPVNVVPQIKAGGSFATTAYGEFESPVAVEMIKGHLGLDVGDTFIGMHLKHVAVPVRLSLKEIGCAHLTAARTRAKFIGGIRAKYLD